MNRTIFLLSALLIALPALAQDEGAKQPPASPAAVSKAREQIDDLGLLKALIPLKLTSAQIEAILVPMRAASATAVKLQKQSDDAVAALAPDVAKAYQDAIAGKPVPEALEKKVADGTKAASERYLAARRKAVSEILAVAKEKLTETQKKEAERQCIAFYGGKRVPAQYKENPDKAPRDVVLDLAVQGYIEQVLLFDRTMTLLEKMREAEEKS
ncbi:MAG: hypothetical protein QM758_10705 [Armatimonas sp.]